MRRTLCTIALGFAIVLATSHAAPPPPGWEERQRAEVCTSAPPEQDVRVTVRELPPARAGVRSRIAAIRFERALELRYDAAFGRTLGIASIPRLGLLLATDGGYWLRLPPRASLGRDLRTITAVPMVDPGRPVAQSDPILGGTSIVARSDGGLVAYDLAFCGLGAKPQPHGQVIGASVRTLAIASPFHVGFAIPLARHVLAGGTIGGRWQEAAFGLGPATRTVTVGPPLAPAPGAGRPEALAGWDVEGGCDAVRFVAYRGSTRATSLCSPDFSESTVELRGDVGVHVTRAVPGRAGAMLADLAFPVTAASDGLVLTAREAGRFRLTMLAVQSAAYREDPRTR